MRPAPLPLTGEAAAIAGERWNVEVLHVSKLGEKRWVFFAGPFAQQWDAVHYKNSRRRFGGPDYRVVEVKP